MSSSSLAIEFLCPICHKLPLDHVVAEDGFIYCRRCIEEFMRDNGVTSPMLGTDMGKLLINSEVIAETIQDLIQCEDINKNFLPSAVLEKRKHSKDDTADKIPNTKHESQDDDMNNAYHGYCLITGKEGVEKDWEEGFELLVEMASQKSNQKARGKPTFSLLMTCISYAQLISSTTYSPIHYLIDFAAYTLGHCYEHGILGFKYNEKKSKKWYSLVVTKSPNAYDLFVEFMNENKTPDVPKTVDTTCVDEEEVCSSLLSPSVNSDELTICKSCSKTIIKSNDSYQSKLCQSCKVIGSVKG